MCSLLKARDHFPEQESPRLCPSWCCNELGVVYKHTLDENPKLCYLKLRLPFHAELQPSTGQPHCPMTAWHRPLLSLDPSALGEVHSSQGRSAVVLPPPPEGKRRSPAKPSPQTLHLHLSTLLAMSPHLGGARLLCADGYAGISSWGKAL